MSQDYAIKVMFQAQTKGVADRIRNDLLKALMKACPPEGMSYSYEGFEALKHPAAAHDRHTNSQPIAIGRIVHVQEQTPSGFESHPAMVMRVHDQNRLNLLVFSDLLMSEGGTRIALNVPFDGGLLYGDEKNAYSSGTWHWPPRATRAAHRRHLLSAGPDFKEPIEVAKYLFELIPGAKVGIVSGAFDVETCGHHKILYIDPNLTSDQIADCVRKFADNFMFPEVA